MITYPLRAGPSPPGSYRPALGPPSPPRPPPDPPPPPPGRPPAARFLPPRPRSAITTPPLISSAPTRTGASGLRLQASIDSTQPAARPPLPQPQEHALPRVPRQQPIHDPAATTHDL